MIMKNRNTMKCVCRLGAKMPDEKHKNGQCEIALLHCKLCKEGIKFLESTVTHECITSLSVKISWSAMPDYSKNQNIQSVSICWDSYSIYIKRCRKESFLLNSRLSATNQHKIIL